MSEIRAGDVVLVRSVGFFSRLIRWATRSPGEPRTVVNHVGIIVDPALIVESGTTTLIRRFSEAYPKDSPSRWYVYRNNSLTPDEVAVITKKALSYIGRKYGWLKIAAHAADHLLFSNKYVARRLLFMDDYPICSWVVAYAYDAAGRSFGVPPSAADPDDVWDWIVEKNLGEVWELVDTNS